MASGDAGVTVSMTGKKKVSMEEIIIVFLRSLIIGLVVSFLLLVWGAAIVSGFADRRPLPDQQPGPNQDHHGSPAYAQERGDESLLKRDARGRDDRKLICRDHTWNFRNAACVAYSRKGGWQRVIDHNGRGGGGNNIILRGNGTRHQTCTRFRKSDGYDQCGPISYHLDKSREAR